MRKLSLLLLLCTLTLAAAAAATPEIRVVNDARLPPAQISRLQRDYARWAERIYRYNHVEAPAPVTLQLTRAVDIGYYLESVVYLPPDEPDEMLETWVHELAHHATGHDSSFFFKEGIAVNTLEALFAEDGRIPQGWPQYGQPNDAWVNLFMQRGELPPLSQLIGQESYEGGSHADDFRSWQVYVVGGSFVGWLIRNEGYAAFRKAFEEETLGAKAAEWEQRWKADIAARKWRRFDVAGALPGGARYRYYADRLRGR